MQEESTSSPRLYDSNDEEGDENSKHRFHCKINRKRLVSKLFYLFFFSAFGSLWPYLSLYFKQLFLSPRQLGILVAVRSLVQFVFTPVWGALADRFNKSKLVLLLGLSAWLLSTFSLAIIPIGEKPKACFEMNSLSLSLYQNTSTRRSNITRLPTRSRAMKAQRHTLKRSYESIFGSSKFLPWALSFFSRELEREESTKLTENTFPDIKFHPSPEKISDSSRLFVFMLCIIVVGQMFASPTQCLADTATLQILAEDSHEYGKQAFWGSVGYGMTAFIVGTAISGRKTLNPCSQEMDINYIPCFYVFAFYMVAALIVACRFRYKPVDHSQCKETAVGGLKVLRNFDYAFFLFIVFYCGTAFGFIQTFLFWHLRELGSPQILFGLIILTNSTAEVVIYLLSERLLSNIGHFRVMYLGLLCYALRFFYYSYCSRPWLFLPIELIQGITTAALWSSFVSHVGAEPGIATTLQGLVNGFYTGLGYASGGLLGGVMVHEFGTSTAFLVFGELTLIVLFVFIIVNNVRHTEESKSDVNLHTMNQADDFN
ncbi:major facilitator superfamily domain-containing protein 6-A-like [Montipora capricornis]|uniref:major facilitator superfamily domain-containing protein 6-A-like n=1 Tax=Montipora foliosa TaxID=591990 RepID=UPI0035F1D5B1